MGWFTDTTTAPKIMLEGYRYTQRLPFVIMADSTSPKGYHREIVETNYEFRGLTYAAADSIAAAKKSLSTDSNQIDARWRRQNDAGGYAVVVQQHTRSAWVAGT